MAKKKAKKNAEWVSTLKDQAQDYFAIEDELKNLRLCKISLNLIILGEMKETFTATRKLQAFFKRKEYKFNIETILAPNQLKQHLSLDDEYIKLSDRFDEWTAKGAVFYYHIARVGKETLHEF